MEGESVETTQEGTSQEFVELHEASDDDIEAFLNAPELEDEALVEQPQADPEAGRRGRLGGTRWGSSSCRAAPTRVAHQRRCSRRFSIDAGS